MKNGQQPEVETMFSRNNDKSKPSRFNLYDFIQIASPIYTFNLTRSFIIFLSNWLLEILPARVANKFGSFISHRNQGTHSKVEIAFHKSTLKVNFLRKWSIHNWWNDETQIQTWRLRKSIKLNCVQRLKSFSFEASNTIKGIL